MTPWPGWVGTWYGIVTRLALGLAGVVLGLLLIFLGTFGATFGNQQPEWDFEASAVLLMGLIVVVTSLAAAIRPGKVTIAIWAISLVAVPVLGASI